MNLEQAEKIESILKSSKQKQFDTDPNVYCEQNGMGINSNGICDDYRNQYLYRLYPFDPEFSEGLISYNEFARKQAFPVGLGEFLMAQAKPEALAKINIIVDEVNSQRGTLDELIAKSYYDKLEALCRTGI